MSTRCSFRGRALVVAAVCAAVFGPPVRAARAQSLADVAKKEEERRKTGAEPAKVYTNKDLKGRPETSPGDASTPADSKDASKDKDAKDADKDKASKDKDASKEPVKDKAYWSGRLKALEDKLLRDSNYLDAMQTRINALTTDFVNRDDPVQRSAIERDRQKAITELNRLKDDVAADKKAIADFQEEARRAGVPPGWLR